MIRFAFLAASIFPAAAIGASGQLLDQDGKPVADAWVVARRDECIGVAHCNTHCVEVKVARTDARGNYAFAGLRPLGAYALAVHREGYLLTYRYVGASPRPEHFLARGGIDPRYAKMDPVSARVTHLAKTASEMSCFTAPQPERAALLPVYQSMFREASAIARHAEHHREARAICREMYWLQLRPSHPSDSPNVERAKQEAYLQRVEPACNAPIDDSRERELLAALERGNAAPVREAAQQGFDLNRRLDGRYPPIVSAAMKGSATMVAELGRAGVRADEPGADGRTALDHVLSGSQPRERRVAVVRALLEAGADARRPDVWGFPPIVKRGSDREMLELLLAHGARADERVVCSSCSQRGYTLLHVVSDPEAARIVIARGADVNAKAQYGNTPLALNFWEPVVKVLLEHGGDPNIANDAGWTPLMYALQRYESFRGSEHRQRYSDVPALLVVAGARLETRNQHNVDAFYYTKDEAMKQRLREIAAKR